MLAVTTQSRNQWPLRGINHKFPEDLLHVWSPVQCHLHLTLTGAKADGWHLAENQQHMRPPICYAKCSQLCIITLSFNAYIWNLDILTMPVVNTIQLSWMDKEAIDTKTVFVSSCKHFKICCIVAYLNMNISGDCFAFGVRVSRLTELHFPDCHLKTCWVLRLFHCHINTLRNMSPTKIQYKGCSILPQAPLSMESLLSGFHLQLC